MEYQTWREAILGSVCDDPFNINIPNDVINLPPEETLKHISLVMFDEQVHSRYSETQISVGLYLLFNYLCSNLPCAFISCKDEEAVAKAVRDLSGLYSNYFSKYCSSPVDGIDTKVGTRMEHICFMFWDDFVIDTEERIGKVKSACLDVLSEALNMNIEQCQISAIHGLGHWVDTSTEARDLLNKFIETSTLETNAVIICYAKRAITGVIQ